TGDPLADAFLWVKVRGKSDGQYSRGLSDRGGVDPECASSTGRPATGSRSRRSSSPAWPCRRCPVKPAAGCRHLPKRVGATYQP
ncbi:MAG: hypothetical protein ACJ715_15145, partial [Ornithinibacter sp.]